MTTRLHIPGYFKIPPAAREIALMVAIDHLQLTQDEILLVDGNTSQQWENLMREIIEDPSINDFYKTGALRYDQSKYKSYLKAIKIGIINGAKERDPDIILGANLTGETIGPRIPTKVGRPVLTEDQILEMDAKKEERRLANIEATRVRKGEREAKKIAADLEYQEDMKKVLEETGSTYLPTTEKQMEKLSESLKGLI